MRDEALDLALEALEGVVKNCWRDIPSWRLDEIIERITAIKQALAAQPAPVQYTALEQAFTRLEKWYAELEAKAAAQPAVPEKGNTP